MEELLYEQLNNIDSIDISSISDNTTIIHLQQNKLGNTKNIEENHCYLFELESYIINPPPNFSLAANWNKGISPTSKYLKVDVCKIMGNMICVNGRGYDIESNIDKNDFYDGLWLPRKSITIIKELI